MKFRVVAMGMIAANFTFTSVANSQQYGYGQYGGNVPCGYANGPASGAVSEDDDLAEMLMQKRDIKKEIKDYEREIDRVSRTEPGLKQQIEAQRKILDETFKPAWAQAFTEHMDRQMNCGICGSDLEPIKRPFPTQPVPAPAPPTYKPNPEQNDPPQNQNQNQNRPDPAQTAPSRPAPVPPSYSDAKPSGGSVQAAPAQTQAAVPKPAPTTVIIGSALPNPETTTKPKPPVRPKPVTVDESDSDKPGYIGTTQQCREKFKSDPGFKALKGNKAKEVGWCKNKDYFSSNTLPSNNRMPASEGRMPAQASPRYAEAVANGGSSGGSAPTAPAANAPAPGTDWGPDVDDFGGGYGGESRGPSKCYNADTQPYGRRDWKAACRDGGVLNPKICSAPHFLNDRSAARNAYKCENALKTYLQLQKDLVEAQEKLSGAQGELSELERDIAELKREKRSNSKDNEIIAASGGRRSGGGGSTGPSTGRLIAGAVLGGALGYGAFRLANSGKNRFLNDWTKNNEALTSIGWQTMPAPYIDNSAAIGAGAGVGLSVLGAFAGGQNGSVGCSTGGIGGVNGNIFGNPYAQNPYAQVGGGMYNGMGPWGVSGPGIGAGFNAGFGGQFGSPYGGGYGQSPFGGGFNGQLGGQFGSPFGGGNGYGFGQSPFGGGYGLSPFGGGLGGQFGAGYGSPYGNGYGGSPFGGGQFGSPFGGGYGQSPFGNGYGQSPYGGGLGVPYQAQMYQMQLEQYQRSQAASQANAYQYSQLGQKAVEIQNQMYSLGQYGGGSGYGYGSGYGGNGNGYGSNYGISGGLSIYGGVGTGYGSSYYPSMQYNPSIYNGSSILNTTGPGTTVPSSTVVPAFSR